MEDILTIEGKTFRLVKISRRGEVAVYTSGELFVRVGEKEVIDKMVELHKKFDEFGFPVPEIVGRGEIGGQGYFLEKSFGEKCFSYLFKDDIEKHGQISLELFEKFVAVSEKFARAQLRSAQSVSEGLTLAEMVRPEDLAEELPEFKEVILERFAESAEAVKSLPIVLTHGDYNSHNLFPAGVIDFEKIYACPVGYDLVTAIFHINYFPKSADYEYYQIYDFTPEHAKQFYEKMDGVFAEYGLSPLSLYRRHFEYMRAVWLTARNQRMPKFQQWRYELFKKSYLK
ncbi:MAG: aminoglycoside phosphotransferase family protein [Candidatus Taylorbacteria bacterium]|nr:aminoglycoside phosphotransferase family protein [Candidatus Taylorbacteria bacterium]